MSLLYMASSFYLYLEVQGTSNWLHDFSYNPLVGSFKGRVGTQLKSTQDLTPPTKHQTLFSVGSRRILYANICGVQDR